ncbi:MAG: 50S ribosomal protein L10 [Acidobacteriota bacterium]|jgi:large subunit ribosomal protein L10|nr:50S ribosomal protein L10 [Acidobacteriota bacterium]
MKTRERKQEDLNALTEQLNNSKSAMVVGFNKLSVNKDQEFRNYLRDAGANFRVVKNTLARIAVKGTPYEDASEYFKGVTGIAWTENDAVVLSKAVSKFVKDNADIYTFKAGVVEGRVVNLIQVEAIASLPSKEQLISKLMFVINAQAQRIVTVINAVPRNLAVVIKQIGEGKTDVPAEQKTEQQEEAKQPEQSDVAEETKDTTQESEQIANKEEAQAEAKPEIEPSSEQSVEQIDSPEEAVTEEKSE